MNERYFTWYTRYLERDFEMLVFGHAGLPILLFPTSMSRYFQYKDFSLVETARPFLERGEIRIYCPDSIDQQSWYNRNIHPADRVKTHQGYERVILNDVLPRIEQESGTHRVVVGGCSFGAFHAANFAFRHPSRAMALICLGGSFDIKQFLDGYYDDNCYFNNPVDYLPGLDDPDYLEPIRQTSIVLGTGEHDICLTENVRLSEILHSKAIPHWLDVRPGGYHDWPWWKAMFQDYMAETLRGQGVQ